MRGFKKTILIILILGDIFLAASGVKADTILYSHNANNQFIVFSVFQPSTSGYLTSIDTNMIDSLGIGNSTHIYLIDCNNGNTLDVSTNLVNVGINSTPITAYFSGNVFLSNSSTYGLFYDDYYADEFDADASTGILCNGSYEPLLNGTVYGTTTSPPTTPTITFNYPTNGSTVDPSFSDWSLNFNNLSTSTTYQAEVIVSTTPIVANEETFLGYDPNYMTYYFKSKDVNTNIYSSSGSLNNIGVIKTENLNYGTTYYAAAALFDNFLNIIATSSIVFNTASSSLYLEPYATTTFNTTTPPLLTTTTPPTPPIFSENLASSTCSQYGFIGNSICEAGLFLGNVLFIPSTSTLAQWGSLGDLIKTKPPVGYFYAALDALNSLKGGSGANLLISSSTLLAFSVVFNPLDTGLAVILWIVFAFYIIKRLKQIEL